MADAAPPPKGSAGSEEDSEKDSEEDDAVTWASWSAVGFQFGACVALFFLLGSWADARWGTAPWMRVAGALIGVVLGTYLLIVQAVRSGRTKGRQAEPAPKNKTPRA